MTGYDWALVLLSSVVTAITVVAVWHIVEQALTRRRHHQSRWSV